MTMVAVSAFLVVAPRLTRKACAQGSDQAISFVQSTTDKLVSIVNSAESAKEKRRRLQEIIDSSVDVDDIARFCLGRFWHLATPDQQKQYLALFRKLMVIKVAFHLGEYQGVRITMGLSRKSADTDIVITLVERSETPISRVDWVVSTSTGSPKIVDVLAEGTSLRLTQSAEFASYLSRHLFNMDDLIEGMGQLVSHNIPG
jgi:phospholipid transport system substrate-binding protein